MILKLMVVQMVATVIAVLLCSICVGMRGGVSAALGGLACMLPNLLLAWRVTSAFAGHRVTFIVVLFLGELAKIAVILGLLLFIAKAYADLHWPSLLVGLVLATYALLFLAFWKKS